MQSFSAKLLIQSRPRNASGQGYPREGPICIWSLAWPVTNLCLSVWVFSCLCPERSMSKIPLIPRQTGLVGHYRLVPPMILAKNQRS